MKRPTETSGARIFATVATMLAAGSILTSSVLGSTAAGRAANPTPQEIYQALLNDPPQSGEFPSPFSTPTTQKQTPSGKFIGEVDTGVTVRGLARWDDVLAYLVSTNTQIPSAFITSHGYVSQTDGVTNVIPPGPWSGHPGLFISAAAVQVGPVLILCSTIADSPTVAKSDALRLIATGVAHFRAVEKASGWPEVPESPNPGAVSGESDIKNAIGQMTVQLRQMLLACESYRTQLAPYIASVQVGIAHEAVIVRTALLAKGACTDLANHVSLADDSFFTNAEQETHQGVVAESSAKLVADDLLEAVSNVGVFFVGNPATGDVPFEPSQLADARSSLATSVGDENRALSAVNALRKRWQLSPL